jgi:hypothetical protein
VDLIFAATLPHGFRQLADLFSEPSDRCRNAAVAVAVAVSQLYHLLQFRKLGHGLP